MENEKLENSNTCEMILPELSGKFFRAAVQEIDGLIQWALKRIGECLDIDRCAFWEISPGQDKLYVIHQYTAPGVSRDPFLFPNDYLPKTLEDAKNGQHFFFNDTEELNSEGPLLKEKFHRLNIKAALFIPYNPESVKISILFCFSCT